MYAKLLIALVISAVLATTTIGQFNTDFNSKSNLQAIYSRIDIGESSGSSKANKVFLNPALKDKDVGCLEANINFSKLDDSFSDGEKQTLCEAFAEVSKKLNSTKWSAGVNTELREIWRVFQSEQVMIRPMKKGVTKRIAAAAEGVLPKSRKGKFEASFYVRPESSLKSSFFLVAMHELRHIYDYYQISKARSAVTKAEMERRGFRIMGRIAAETEEKESFYRLPKLWDKDWASLTKAEIITIRERNITSYMKKSRFYKHLIASPSKYMVGYEGLDSMALSPSSEKLRDSKAGRLPYLVTVRNPKFEASQNVMELPFETAIAKDTADPAALLTAAIENEKNLYFRMDNFVYDQKLNLECWKKDVVTESLNSSAQIARTTRGQTLRNGEKTTFTNPKKTPKCIVDFDSINTDASETFWSAPYLDEMQVQFDYMSELDGKKVARYTVYKPTQAKFDEIAVKYPFVKPFRVFFGTIFVSVEDSQIIKFWGSSFPERATTGQNSRDVLASYNATAVRQKLSSGIWVTTKIDTVAVAHRKGKMRPFSYVVNYNNYRQTETELLILDDEDEVIALQHSRQVDQQ